MIKLQREFSTKFRPDARCSTHCDTQDTAMKQSHTTGIMTVTAAHIRLCILSGTNIDTGHETTRYYYKGLCVLAHAHSFSRSCVCILDTPRYERTADVRSHALQRCVEKEREQQSKREAFSEAFNDVAQLGIAAVI